MNYRGNCGFDAAESMQTLGPRIFSCTLTYYSNLSPAQPAAVKLGAGFGITTGEKQPLTCEYGLYATGVAAECQVTKILIGPRNKIAGKRPKKRFSRENYSSTVPNYKLRFLIKPITQTPLLPMCSPDSASPFLPGPIDQNTMLESSDAFPGGLIEVWCDYFHKKKWEIVIRNGGGNF
jgi:hypothetical protein